MAASTEAEAAAAAAAVEQLGDAITRSIQSGGAELPSVVLDSRKGKSGTSTTSDGGAAGGVQWTEYASTARPADAVVAELHASATSIQRRFQATMPDFDVSIAFDANGRPLLYAACLGLALAD